MDGWIVIPNWRRFQHYRDRDPAWIKVYTELHSDADYLALTMRARGLLLSCWLEYARARGVLRPKQIAGIAGAGFKYAHLEALRDAGFIDIVASKPLAHSYKPASPEVRSREDKEKVSLAAPAKAAASDTDTRAQLLAAARRFAHGWNGGTSDAFDAGLDELEQAYGKHLQAGDRYRLWEAALTNGATP